MIRKTTLLRHLVLAALATAVLAPSALASHRSAPRIDIGVRFGNVGVGFSTQSRVVNLPPPRPSYRVVSSGVCAPARVWVPARYEVRVETVRLPGHYEDVWVEPIYERRVDHCGVVTEVLVRPGYTHRVWVEGPIERREVRVWVPGRFA